MNNKHEAALDRTARMIQRRQFLRDSGLGLGKIALASLLAGNLPGGPASAAEPTKAGGATGTHFAPQAKRVIYLFMAGAPSQLELFDHKPKLTELEGKPIPPSVIKGQRYAFIQPDAAVLGPRFRFARTRQVAAPRYPRHCHIWPSVVDRHLQSYAPCDTDLFNHAPAQLFYEHRKRRFPGGPAWVRLAELRDWQPKPTTCRRSSCSKAAATSAAARPCGAAGSTAVCEHQGVPFRSQGDPDLACLKPARASINRAQRETLDLIRRAESKSSLTTLVIPKFRDTHRRRMKWHFACRSRAPELMDFSKEDPKTLAAYGAKPGDGKAAFANNCLLARRLAERGVRLIQVYHSGWDHHSNVEGGVKRQCAQTDQSCAALIADLKKRGMLEDTLVVWGGEFGRTPMVESSAALGRSLGTRPSSAGVFRCGSPAAASSRVFPSARPTSLVFTSSRIRCMFTTCKPRSCIASASTTAN